MQTNKALYKPGQMIRHNRYGYRAVVVDIDTSCNAPDEWYEHNQTHPDRDQPWYHVLVSGSDSCTYPAQSSIIPDESFEPISNPLVEQFFSEFIDGKYIRNENPWPYEWK